MSKRHWQEGATLFIVAFLVLFIHLPDAIATWYIGRKGLYPQRTLGLGGQG